MGRSICAEEKIEKTVESFYKEPWTIGLIIGQVRNSFFSFVGTDYCHQTGLVSVTVTLTVTD